MVTFLSFKKGTIEYYMCLAAMLFDYCFDQTRFLTVVKRFLSTQNEEVDIPSIENTFKRLPYCLEIDKRVHFSAGKDWENQVQSMEASVLKDGLNLLQRLALSLKEPWLFRAAGNSLGKLCAVRPMDVLPVIKKLSLSNNRACRQAAALALKSVGKLEQTYMEIDQFIVILKKLVSDDKSEEVRKFARQAGEQLAINHKEQITSMLTEWSQDPNERVRLSAALLLRKEFVIKNKAEELLSKLEKDSDPTVRHAASEAKKLRSSKRMSPVKLDANFKKLWKFKDNEVFCEKFNILKAKIPTNQFWNAMRNVVIKPLVRKSDHKGINKAVDRLAQCYPSPENILLSISPVFEEEWKVEPSKVRYMLAAWYLTEERYSRMFVTQALRNRGRKAAHMIGEMFIEIYKISDGIAPLDMLDQFILGKIATPSGYKANLKHNLCTILIMMYQEDRAIICEFLRKWLRSDNLTGLGIAIATIVQIASRFDNKLIHVFGDELGSKARARAGPIFSNLANLAIDERFKKTVLRILYNLLSNKFSEIQLESTNRLLQIEHAHNSIGKSCLTFLTELANGDGLTTPKSMTKIWNSSEIVIMLAERVSGTLRSKEVFQLCSLLDNIPSIKEIEREYTKLAIEDYRIGTLERSKFSLIHLYRVFDDLGGYYGGGQNGKRRLIKRYDNRVPRLSLRYIEWPSDPKRMLRHGGKPVRHAIIRKDIEDYRQTAFKTLFFFLSDHSD